MGKTFKTIEEFYNDKPARRSSPEADYGVWWTEAGKGFPRWRVSYIKDTGEIYAYDHTKVELLGTVQPDADPVYYRTLDDILAGWAEIIWRPGSLDWVRQRMKEHTIAANMEDYWKHTAAGAETN